METAGWYLAQPVALQGRPLTAPAEPAGYVASNALCTAHGLTLAHALVEGIWAMTKSLRKARLPENSMHQPGVTWSGMLSQASGNAG